MIFLDTGYFRAIMDNRDIHHEDALKIEEYIDDYNETTVINMTVLVDALNWSVGTNDDLNDLFDELCSKNDVIFLKNEDYYKALEINGWYGNSINYSDCTIINTMMDLGIKRIVSFDNSFKKINGYTVISAV